MNRPRASYEQYRASRDPKPPGAVDDVVGGLLSWIFVVVGVAAIAVAGLIPAYLRTLDMQDDRRVLEVRAQSLKEVHDRFAQFHTALADDDPILIERLALRELRLRPVGTAVAETGPRDLAAVIDSPDPDAIRQHTDVWVGSGGIEQWLSRTDLHLEPPAPERRPRQTRLLTYATGEHRPWVAGFGALLILLGLWPRKTRASAKAERSDGTA